MLASWAGDVLAIVTAVGIFLVCGALAYVLLKTSDTVNEATLNLRQIREETGPLLTEVRTTVKNVNRELDRADVLLESAGNIAKSAERLSNLMEQTVSSPLVKFISVGAGASKAFKSLFGGS